MNNLAPAVSTSTSTSLRTTADRATADLIGSFANRLEQDLGEWFLPALPTPEQRQRLVTRQSEVRQALRPISLSDADRQKAAIAITAMLTAWIHTGKADPKSTVAAYVMHMQDVPLFAIEKACADVARGYVEGVSPDFPPSAARLHQLAIDACEALAREEANIKKILSAKLAYTPSPEERERVKEKFRLLAEALKGMPADPETEQRKEEGARRIKEATERAKLREYEALGVEPVYAADGFLLSPSLLKQLGAMPKPKEDSHG